MTSLTGVVYCHTFGEGPVHITVAVSDSYRDKTCSISPFDAHKNMEGAGTLATLLDKVFFVGSRTG